MFRLCFAICLFLANPAFGLSCKAPNFAERFNYIAGVEEVYSLLHGRFQEAGPIPEPVAGQPREFALAFIGKAIGQQGSGETVTIPVIVKTSCVGEWCGPTPPLGENLLLFAEHLDQDHGLNVDACPADYHVNPSLGQLAAIRACMTDLQCGAEEISAFELN